MRNRTMYEDVDWDEISNAEDNLVPICDEGSLSDRVPHKKKRPAYQRTEEANDQSSLANGKSPSNQDLYGVFPQESHLQRIDKGSSVPSNDSGTSVDYFDGNQENTHGDGRCDDMDACQLTSSATLSENKRAAAKKNGASTETGLLDCEWDEFGDFELFRNGGTGSAEEFSWLSSPCTIDFDSSHSEFNPLNMTFLLEDKPPNEDCCRSSFTNCADAKWMDAPIEDMCPMKSTSGLHPSNEDETLSDFAQILEEQNNHSYAFPRVDSVDSIEPFISQKDWTRVSISSMESERGSNIYPSYRLIDESSRSASTANCPTEETPQKVHPPDEQFQPNEPCYHKNGQTCDPETGEKCLEVLKLEKDCSTGGEKNGSSGICNDGSLGSACFMKFHDVLDQLDSTTKLCIRDSLYRLARNAELRGICTSSETLIDRESNQPCERLVETGTNAIDRSIAQLLFYRAPETSKNPVNHDIKS